MGLLMFESALAESSGQLKSKSGRYLVITAAFNAAVVGVMIVIPLLYPDALPRTVLAATLTAPLPPPVAAPQPVKATVVQAMKATAPLNALIAPSRVPTEIDMTHEDAPAPTLGAGIVGMSSLCAAYGSNTADAIGMGAPTVVKVLPPKTSAPTHISSGVIAGNKLSGSDPVYPPIARAAHVSGAVVLHAIISKAGTIQRLSVLSGPEMLRASAVASVQDWRYKPYLLNGEPTEVETTITVNFTFGG